MCVGVCRCIAVGVKMGAALQRDGRLRPCSDVVGDRSIEHSSAPWSEDEPAAAVVDGGWRGHVGHGPRPRGLSARGRMS